MISGRSFNFSTLVVGTTIITDLLLMVSINTQISNANQFTFSEKRFVVVRRSFRILLGCVAKLWRHWAWIPVATTPTMTTFKSQLSIVAPQLCLCFLTAVRTVGQFRTVPILYIIFYTYTYIRCPQKLNNIDLYN